MKKKSGRVKIISKTRFAIFIIIVVLTFGILAGEIFKLDKAYSSTYQKWDEVIVKRGDTLWIIAKNNNPHSHDVRKVVYEIMEFNNMKNPNLIPGDIIKIPIS